MRRGDVSSCSRQRGEAVRGHPDFLTGSGRMGPRTSQDQLPHPRTFSLRYDPQPCPGWTLGGRHEPDTGTHSLNLSVLAGVGSEDCSEGGLQPGAAKSGRRMGHEGPRRKQKHRAGGRWALQWSQRRAPHCSWPHPAPPSASAPPQALTRGSAPTGPSPPTSLLSGGAAPQPLGPSAVLSCGL